MKVTPDHRRKCIRLMLLLATVVLCAQARLGAGQTPLRSGVVHDRYGAITRGDVSQRKLAIVFTGDQHGEGLAAILDTLGKRKIKGGFFVTGNFVRQPRLKALLQRAIEEGHYLGPHSDSHPLYCSWEDREKTLVTREFFADDLKRNLAGLEKLGALPRGAPRLFIPPYEWYNAEQVRWSTKLGVTLINFTPGSGSNRDYAPEGDQRFVPSRTIFDDILAYEAKDPHGLNGFLLLLHLGSGRKDPFHPLLGPLLDELASRGYEFARVDELVSGP